MDYKEKYEEVVKIVNFGELYKYDNTRQEDVAHKIIIGRIKRLIRDEDFREKYYETTKDII